MLPLFPLGTVLVPGMRVSLHVFEPRYRRLVLDLLAEEPDDGPIFGIVALRRGAEVGQLGDVHPVGTTARVTDLDAHPDGRFDLVAVGEDRFAVDALDTTAQPYLTAEVSYLPEPDEVVAPAAVREAQRLWLAHVTALVELTGSAAATPEPPADPRQLSYAIAQLPSLNLGDRQALLGCRDTSERLACALPILRRETVLLSRLHALPASPSALAAEASAS